MKNLLIYIGFSLIFIIGMLMLGGGIGLMPDMAEDIVVATLIIALVIAFFRWRRKKKVDSDAKAANDSNPSSLQ